MPGPSTITNFFGRTAANRNRPSSGGNPTSWLISEVQFLDGNQIPQNQEAQGQRERQDHRGVAVHESQNQRILHHPRQSPSGGLESIVSSSTSIVLSTNNQNDVGQILEGYFQSNEPEPPARSDTNTTTQETAPRRFDFYPDSARSTRTISDQSTSFASTYSSSALRNKIVYSLNCRYCSSELCNRAMRAILLADTKVELYSTDIPPRALRLLDEDRMTQGCHCRIRDTLCFKCGNVMGYHVSQPCDRCLEARNNGHFWMFYSEGIRVRERQDTEGKGPLFWISLTPMREFAPASSFNFRPFEETNSNYEAFCR